jgi:predicted flap endonuclease-1-like 5' DNA nuclease
MVPDPLEEEHVRILPGLGTRWWAVLATLVSLAAALVAAGWLGQGRLRRQRASSEARAALELAASGKARSAGIEPVEGPGDDLKVIEGIGPRVEAVLHAASIDSFERLAAMRSGRIETMLREAGGRMANPRSWPRQARLAADGRWEDLRRLQARLDRGVVRTRT